MLLYGSVASVKTTFSSVSVEMTVKSVTCAAQQQRSNGAARLFWVGEQRSKWRGYFGPSGRKLSRRK
mgnify:CR=1 FL=1|tara:strand:- start:34 stop:234 length:201 start_codon:yes stop_codon:yes gene_type:complete